MPGAGAGAGAAEKFYSEPEPEPEPECFPGAGAGAGADQKCHGSASLLKPLVTVMLIFDLNVRSKRSYVVKRAKF